MSDDTISRQAAIELVHHTIFGFFGIAKDNSESIISDEELRLFEINKAINNGIKALPSAEPQSKKGEWKGEVRMYSNGHPRYIYHCSECGFKEEHAYADTPCSKYCPNCGAKMEEEES